MGLVGLALYGLVLASATLTPEPDQTTDPAGWARFVTTSAYLVGHLGSNVVGAVLVILGTFALDVVLAHGRSPRLGLVGMVLAVAGQILFLVPRSISTFATPAIGAAYLSGNQAVMTLEFSPALAAVVALALLLAFVGNVLLGVAIWRSGRLPRWAGLVWIAGTLVCYGALGMATTGANLPTQPIGAVLLAIAGAWIASAVIRRPTEAVVP